jgi:hypothetical protein
MKKKNKERKKEEPTDLGMVQGVGWAGLERQRARVEK